MPLFVRDGAVVPMLKEPVTNTGRAYGQALEVRHYGSAPGSFDLFEDDGKTFDYERGRYRIRRLRVEAGEGGRLSLRETVVKGVAPPMFGQAELRAMTR
jgi:alpha-D-xyloside xylohydrolase